MQGTAERIDPAGAATAAVAGGGDGGEEHGRAVVRAVLIDRLDEAGLVRPKKLSVAEHAALRDRLADHLAYMGRDNLERLAETLISMAAGPLRNEWPCEATVRNYAAAIQRRPWRENRIMRSWLASVEGPVAEARGVLVELYRHLRKTGIPPQRGAYFESMMAQEAQDNRRRCALIEERIDAGVAIQADRDWLTAYRQDEQEARALVEAGRARRATGGQEGQDNED